MNNAGRIKHLLNAFFTKWLYFVSALASADDPNAAPILDKQVREWLEQHADMTLDISRTPDYQRYFETLTARAEIYGRTPVQVEKAIFGLQPAARDRLHVGMSVAAPIVRRMHDQDSVDRGDAALQELLARVAERPMTLLGKSSFSIT